MKTISAVSAGVAILALTRLQALAANYPDSIGDNGGSFLDITSVDVNNTATTLTFTINVAGDPSNPANNWGTYLIGFDTATGGGGNINATGGWGKSIQMSQGGMDFFIGSWLNNGAPPAGAELHNWTGSAWGLVTATWNANPYHISATESPSSLTISLDYAALGLSAGSTFHFDVYASANDNTVVDASSNPALQTWNNNPYDSGANVSTYSIAAVPEPATLALFGLGASMVVIHRRRAWQSEPQ